MHCQAIIKISRMSSILREGLDYFLVTPILNWYIIALKEYVKACRPGIKVKKWPLSSAQPLPIFFCELKINKKREWFKLFEINGHLLITFYIILCVNVSRLCFCLYLLTLMLHVINILNWKNLNCQKVKNYAPPMTGIEMPHSMRLLSD